MGLLCTRCIYVPPRRFPGAGSVVSSGKFSHSLVAIAGSRHSCIFAVIYSFSSEGNFKPVCGMERRNKPIWQQSLTSGIWMEIRSWKGQRET